ncbi:MAG: hypothetical protein LBU65_00860, partial [Planctomycetaceae bacterium]|nr:hypothetical protein [Planctomycetaceae bacterium]
AKKGDESFFGYKDHPWVDAIWKLIWGYGVTTAKVHDSVPFLDVLPAEPRLGCEQAYADERGDAPQYRFCESEVLDRNEKFRQ